MADATDNALIRHEDSGAMTEAQALEALALDFDWPEYADYLGQVLLSDLNKAGFERHQLLGLEHIAREDWRARRDELRGDDPVNQPSHYQSEDGIECIDAIRAALGRDGFIAHCRGTAIKYAWRSGKKAAHAEDLRKACVYLEWAAKALEEGEE